MLKFQAVAEKMAKNFRGYFFAAPCRHIVSSEVTNSHTVFSDSFGHA